MACKYYIFGSKVAYSEAQIKELIFSGKYDNDISLPSLVPTIEEESNTYNDLLKDNDNNGVFNQFLTDGLIGQNNRDEYYNSETDKLTDKGVRLAQLQAIKPFITENRYNEFSDNLNPVISKVYNSREELSRAGTDVRRLFARSVDVFEEAEKTQDIEQWVRDNAGRLTPAVAHTLQALYNYGDRTVNLFLDELNQRLVLGQDINIAAAEVTRKISSYESALEALNQVHQPKKESSYTLSEENRVEVVTEMLNKGFSDVTFDFLSEQEFKNRLSERGYVPVEGEKLPYAFLEIDAKTKTPSKITINNSIATIEAPIHEMGHIWNMWAAKNAPKVYEAGRKLVESNPVFMDMIQKMYPELEGEALIDEALAKVWGREGARIYSEMENKDKTWWEKIKNWVQNVKYRILESLGLSDRTFNQMTLEDLGAYVGSRYLLSGKPWANNISVEEVQEAFMKLSKQGGGRKKSDIIKAFAETQNDPQVITQALEQESLTSSQYDSIINVLSEKEKSKFEQTLSDYLKSILYEEKGEYFFDYTVFPNTISDAVAEGIISQIGVNKVYTLLQSPESGKLSGGVREMLYEKAIARSESTHQKVILAEALINEGREAGRLLQAMGRLGKTTEGFIVWAKNEVDKRNNITEDVEGLNEEIARLKKLLEELTTNTTSAITQTTIQDIIDGITSEYSSNDLWEKYKAGIFDSITNLLKPNPIVNLEEGVKPPIQEFADVLKKYLADLAKQNKPKTSKTNETDIANDIYFMVMDMKNNPDKYVEVWDKIRDDIYNKHGNDTAIMGILSAMDSHVYNHVIPDNMIRKIVSEQIKSDSIVISELVKEHYSKVSDTVTNLKDKITARTGLDPQFATQLVYQVSQEIDKRIAEGRKKLAQSTINRLSQSWWDKITGKGKIKKSIAEQIIEDYRTGAFNKSNYRTIKGKSLGVGSFFFFDNSLLIEQYIKDHEDAVENGDLIKAEQFIENLNSLIKFHQQNHNMNWDVIVDKLLAGEGITDEITKEFLSKVNHIKIDLSAIIKKHSSVQGVTMSYIIESIMSDIIRAYPLSNDMDKTVRQELSPIIRNLLQEERKNAIDKTVQQLKQKSNKIADKISDKLSGLIHTTESNAKKFVDKLAEYSNTGALTNQDFKNLFSELMGYPVWDTQDTEYLTNLLDKYQTQTSYFRKNEMLQDILSYVAETKGVDIIDYLTSLRYANMLSGIFTHLRNILGNGSKLILDTFINSLADIATGDIKGTQVGLASSYVNIRRGYSEMLNTIKTGYDPTKEGTQLFDTGGVNALEIVGANPNDVLPLRLLNKLKYVSRLLKAADAFFYEIAKGYSAGRGGYYIAKEKGLNYKEILGTSTYYENIFQKQAIRELSEETAKIRTNNNLSKKEKEEAINKSKLDSIRRYYELKDVHIKTHNPDLYLYASNEALRMTYNNKPEGVMGMFAGGLSSARIRYAENTGFRLFDLLLIKSVLPFVNIPINILNSNLEYTPIGAVTAVTNAIRKDKRQSLFGTNDQTNIQLAGGNKTLAGLLSSKTISKAIVGNLAGLILLYLAMPDDDDEKIPDNEKGLQIYGAGPGSYTKQTDLKAKGWIPHSFRLGAGEYHSYANTDLFVLMDILGTISDYKRYYAKTDTEQQQEQKMFLYTSMLFQSVENMSVLAGINQMSQIMSMKEGSAKRFIAGQIKTYVPAQAMIVQSNKLIRDILDMNEKETNRTFFNYLVLGIPIAENIMGDKIGLFGQKIRSDADFINSSQDESYDPKIRELLDIYSQKAVIIDMPKRSTLQVFDIEGGKNKQYYRIVDGVIYDSYDNQEDATAGVLKYGGEIEESEGYSMRPVTDKEWEYYVTIKGRTLAMLLYSIKDKVQTMGQKEYSGILKNINSESTKNAKAALNLLILKGEKIDPNTIFNIGE